MTIDNEMKKAAFYDVNESSPFDDELERVVAEKLQPVHYQLITDMLEDYSNIIGNRCCNDWGFPRSWPEYQKQEFCKLYHYYNGDPEEYSDDYLCIPDFAAVYTLKRMIESHIKTTEKAKHTLVRLSGERNK